MFSYCTFHTTENKSYLILPRTVPERNQMEGIHLCAAVLFVGCGVTSSLGKYVIAMRRVGRFPSSVICIVTTKLTLTTIV